MRKIVQILVITLLLTGTFTTVSFADGTDPPPNCPTKTCP